ncbi:hypothetical protein ABI59_12505 [Acidobacteria bacterium Mor1]|nr:hypothetical protein ABI59_12505 [Acidobacteria bacterium Mor1]
MSGPRYVCVHGHFYQPPRENPWLEEIELQESAHPYHDWNQRITAECYGPNGASRILDDEGRIVRIVNNYARMSFNFGPTLLSWMERHAPEAYRAILAADVESRERFGGHGSAMAQVYSHPILPLCNPRDQVTQVRWGIRDFEHRFGRMPEGMWLPETAVDLASLQTLADHGLRFAVLEPGQAARVRHPGEDWTDVTGGRIDPTRAYRQQLAGGKHIDLFFYDGPVSRAIAFEHLLDRGDRFAARLASGFDDRRQHAQLMHVATDGETYGHHHRFGDMALAFALERLEQDPDIRLTNYGEFLERHPAESQVEIVENTAWSCAHGIERWRSDCGCSGGGGPGWTQAWRTPLRAALDHVRDQLSEPFERETAGFLRDPWEARNDYIDLLLDDAGRDAFLAKHGLRPLDGSERTRVWKLLELQRHALLMYTSCGWFFDDISGIETVQIVQYAARAIQLARETLRGEAGEPLDLDGSFSDMLAAAKSNVAEEGNGQRIYRKRILPTVVDLPHIAAHDAVGRLFNHSGDALPGLDVRRLSDTLLEGGRARLAHGTVRLTARRVEETVDLAYAALHLGDHHVTGAARRLGDEADHQALTESLVQTFEAGDLPGVLRLLDSRFDPPTISLQSLSRDERRRVLNVVLADVLREATEAHQRIYEQNDALIRYLGGLSLPLPPMLRSAGEHVLNARLEAWIEREDDDLETLRGILDEAGSHGITVDEQRLELALRRRMEADVRALVAAPEQIDVLERLRSFAEFLETLSAPADLWRVQNGFYEVLQQARQPMSDRSGGGDEAALRWLRSATALTELLGVRSD